MGKSETFENGFINSLFESAQEAVDTVTPTLQEIKRLSVNGYESAEDAVSAGIALGKEGADFMTEMVKEIRANPDAAIESTKSTISMAAESGKNAFIKTKDAAVETFERRNEIMSDIGGKLDYVVENPVEFADMAKQHVVSLGKGFYRGSIGSLKDVSGHLQVGREDFKILDDILKQQSVEFSSLKSAGNQS